MPRINRAIELLEAGQPIYYSGVHGGLTYENGTAHSDTWADYLMVEFEHGAFNPVGLGHFMRGLVDAGPTRSGHRTPAVICTLPTDGTDENVMRANAWMIKQVLARGVHGILLCHAETPGAVRVFVESSRYPTQSIGVSDGPNGLSQGRRGAGGQSTAAAIWGVTAQEYVQKADVWPLNPDGEIMLGLKIENRRALGKRRSQRRSARHRLRRVGTRRHGNEPGPPGRPRPALSCRNERRPVPRQRGLRRLQRLFPQRSTPPRRGGTHR